MGSGDLEILDLLYTATDDDEPRLKVGDAVSNTGVGQDCAMLCADGFIGLPNAPDGPNAGQAIVLTMGNDRFVIASMDGRYTAAAGSLSPGDRAIVSNCDAALYLSQSANRIEFQASSESMALTLDAAGKTITAKIGSNSVQVSQTAITLTLGPLVLTMTGTNVGISTTTGPPATVAINGVPLTVP